ncbi:MAG: DNA polymerase III subunit delta' [Gammaproteobacteria bacterium]|nr:MAG: DNA polymerase III subunit delta' [Gammaproteobacteria bacterium]
MPTTADRYPWHAAAWRTLVDRHAQGRLPHALLIDGPAGTGRHAFAHRIAAAILCATPDATTGEACGGCRSCQLFSAGSHADFHHLRLLLKGESLGGKKLTQDATRIRIDQVRQLGATLSLSAQHGGWKVTLVEPADLMMPEAANALLKTLEEPTPQTLLMLVATRRNRLLPTIRSRCQRLSLAMPARDQAVAWLTGQGVADSEALLALADGSPLLALDLANDGAVTARREAFDALGGVLTGHNDPVAVAAKWSAADPARLFGWLGSWLVDMIRLKSGAGSPVLDNRDLADRMQVLIETIDLVYLFARLDELQRARRLVETQVNAQLLCEELLLGWQPTRPT